MAQKINSIDPQVVELLFKNTKNSKDLFGNRVILHQLKATFCERIFE